MDVEIPKLLQKIERLKKLESDILSIQKQLREAYDIAIDLDAIKPGCDFDGFSILKEVEHHLKNLRNSLAIQRGE